MADFERACIRKQKYPTQEAAQRIADDVLEQRGRQLRVYQCNACDGWHLTSQIDLSNAKPGWRPARASRREMIYQEKRRRRARRR